MIIITELRVSYQPKIGSQIGRFTPQIMGVAMTYAIIGLCPRTKQMGIGITTYSLAVEGTAH